MELTHAPNNRLSRKRGFTLAELLIALAILGVIATFLIPKVLQAQQDTTYKSIAREAAGTISEAYQIYKARNTVTATTKPSDLTPYMNYLAVDTTTVIDHVQWAGTITCNATEPCLKFHNGSILYFRWMAFGGTNSTNAISFFFDPDGKTDGTINGPGKSVMFFLYTDGKLRTKGTQEPNTVDSQATSNPIPAQDPPWFSWN